MNQNTSQIELLNQVYKELLSALSMLDLKGTDDKVTMALMIVKETLHAISDGRETTPQSIYDTVFSSFTIKQDQEA